ncbi:DUF883 family protein [Halomonas huangheensis]|uniref:DUF883 domain-containing protein n=1 Tax=Halomonas huangheensis TaxID=1178482 RepID=W1N4Z3_9GAMM|nr:DUF883 family protein [Halomonas huangheensis]ERL50574.1 hypothetical protein BJB45_05450 [Halomonas huangheensis]
MATRSSTTTSKRNESTSDESAAEQVAPNTSASAQQLKDELKHLSGTLEELLSATADDSRQNIKQWREKAEARLQETRAHLSEQGERKYRQARQTMDSQVECCDRYVHENPWKSVGIGAAVGVIVGLLIGKR